MIEYTYDNVLINPSKEGIESLIGKEVYFHNNPCLCLDAANENSTVNLGILEEIDKDSINPFVIKKGSAFLIYSCIILKKEEPKPEHVPFENQKEFARAYQKFKESLKYGTFEYDLGVCGIWLKHNDAFLLVVEIWDRGVVIGDINMQTTEIEEDEYLTVHGVTKWKELLEDYTFLDGSPCGKLAEEYK